MASLLLAVIYLAFIGLGLPDSLLGSGWPVMHTELGAPISAMGLVSMIIAAGTVVSSLASDFLTRKLGTGLVTFISVLMTAGAMLGFSFAGAFWVLCIIAVPYGLGAGGVDAALNNYVALHYKSRHMSWLHCFWGMGALISPFIMSAAITGGAGWQGGYSLVSYVQFGLCAVLLFSLPLWKKRAAPEAGGGKPLTLPQTLRLRGVVFILVAFFCYSAVEATAMQWASSYFTEHRQVSAELAAMLGSLFYIGITAGRLVSGFVSEKLGDKRLIRIGIAVMMAGIVLLALPFDTYAVAVAGFLIIGFGCAPVYPSIIHSTPANFGAENSQAVIGVEMAFAYIGTTFMPPLFGLIAQYADIAFLPLYLAVFAVFLLCMTELLNRSKRRTPPAVAE
ncbi:MAG TPA: MFS transporter [Firmicutes bacterium]|nr:MFS transporter [Bacillota bacterium]